MTLQEQVENMGRRAKDTAPRLAGVSSADKDKALSCMAEALKERTGEVLEANCKDMVEAERNGHPKSFLDRLFLNERRIEEMADGLNVVRGLADPIGRVLGMWRRPNGLLIGQVRVPLGVVGIIYEARPNVTVDAAGLCLKAGNAVILRGGAEAIHSNEKIVDILRKALQNCGFPEDAVQLIKNTDREAAKILMRMHKYLDVLIPRGGVGLIRTVVENSTVPVIETGVGNCHIYVDIAADLQMAEDIVFNAKVQRPGVCNAMETLLVHSAVAEAFLPQAAGRLEKAGVELRGCSMTRKILPGRKSAAEDDWYTEYLDLILAVKIVDSMDEAMEHIRKYGTLHSEAIITNNYHAAQRFLNEVDAAAVYVNASTRFTDGFQFGFGAEMGISTQKLHVRGPMGLDALTTTKYIIYGNGQVRS
ncbi:MAG: glutamate-5-semialdehyde dehydrogenase [Bacillota bacterium]